MKLLTVTFNQVMKIAKLVCNAILAVINIFNKEDKNNG